jgi:gamma-glutamyltranspeptidase/glutathione hydrolase
MTDVDQMQARGPVLAGNGMVASEHPLVSQTGVDVLRRGGNAFDAAMAMSALLPVVKPGRSHLGGDAYILVYPADEARVTAICSGGKAPAAASLDEYREGMPPRGGKAIAIPGLVDAWQELGDRWCSMAMSDTLAPAIGYARGGFAVSRELELLLKGTQGMFSKYTALAELLHVNGEPPRMGSRLRQPALADTLEAVAGAGRAAFYEGSIAEQIAVGVQEAGGYITTDDLRHHSADVLDPLSVDYRGYTVYETPPNSQGLILLEELSIIAGYDVTGWGHLSADAIHHMVEAKKLAFEDRQAYAGDAAFVKFDPQGLLSQEHAASRRAAIDPVHARPSALPAASTDTTSFVVVDGRGNCCSFIQSLFAPFGSAVGLPRLGIIMNNRMNGFSLDPSHPNALAPGKRTMHTLNTYMIFRDGLPYLVGNTPGADFQVQTNLQVITGVIDFALDAQASVDAPRWGDTPNGLLVEEGMPEDTKSDLSRRGHTVVSVSRRTNGMGRPQAIVIDPGTGALIGGSDSRGEGGAAGW